MEQRRDRLFYYTLIIALLALVVSVIAYAGRITF